MYTETGLPDLNGDLCKVIPGHFILVGMCSQWPAVVSSNHCSDKLITT